MLAMEPAVIEHLRPFPLRVRPAVLARVRVPWATLNETLCTRFHPHRRR
ncbi:MAG: hypothetical protein IPJ48_11595 [Propionivibrio sp.]|uniref:Uncharacterized protein n=1 Tax=Candidatus Propionivibrio dominans TaxID=2954373 RepID=A0A9D7F7Y0_9RHOO|nr:hypothetical protein [Candidatus Propionivibrio dominans]